MSYSRQHTFSAFNNAYYQLIFTKVDDKPNFSIYAARIRSHLQDGIKYILLLTEPETGQYKVPKGSQYKITDIGWFCIQSRTLDVDYGLKEQDLPDPKDSPLQIECYISERKEDRSIYIVDQLPLVVEMIHRMEMQNKYQYPDTVKLSDCMRSHMCSVKFI